VPAVRDFVSDRFERIIKTAFVNVAAQCLKLRIVICPFGHVFDRRMNGEDRCGDMGDGDISLLHVLPLGVVV
jgi:hypothetical protein